MFFTLRLLFVSLLSLSFILPSISLSETVYTNEQSQDILNFINQNQTNNSTGIPQTVEELQEFVQGVSTNQTNEGTGPIDALTGKRTLTPGEVIKSSTPIDTPVVTIPSTSQSPQQSSQQTSQNSTSNTSGGLSYTLLAPIKTFFPSGSVNISDGGLGVYLNNMYRIGIAVATGLALVMIVVGGLQYVSTDSIQGKSDGKGRIQDALIGLLLALTSYIILNQINPNLLRSELKVAATKSTGRVNTVDVQLVEGGGTVNNPLANYPITGSLLGGVTQGTGVDTPIISTFAGQSVAARIVASARANLNVSTCFPITENGRKGCGYAFGKIMRDAGVFFTNLSSSEVLSTSNIYSVLSSDRRFYLVSINDPSKGLPGDIIIAPTIGSNSGHVGVIETAGAGSIISNSSSAGAISDKFNGTRWLNYYSGKGLKTYLFRYR